MLTYQIILSSLGINLQSKRKVIISLIDNISLNILNIQLQWQYKQNKFSHFRMKNIDQLIEIQL